MKKNNTLKLVYSAVCLALCMVLPFVTGQIPQIGNMLCPMHIPVFLCGILCGWPWGLGVGLVAPYLRCLLFGMPVLFPKAIAMGFELATYGFLSGLLYAKFPKKLQYLYLGMIISMLSGRLVWGVVRYILALSVGEKFTFAMFLSGGFTTAVPGIIIQLILIPAIVMALKKARLVLNE